ncbi:BTB/POZ protein [Rhizophagus irregularis DAOM 181602=DAOM 197198]|nr:BTB/POZ protein [Rhizophagus irregularis DAOM 181602=DAOM 197198]
MVDNKLLPKLSQNLLETLGDEEYYDITIEVGKDPDVKIFRAHRVILNYRSPYLRRVLSTNKKKSDGTLTNIKLPNILPEIFQIILRYIYGGIIPLEEYNIFDILKILVAVNELSLQELIPFLESFLLENKENWVEQHFDLIYQISYENDSFLEIRKCCIDLISKEPNKIFNSPNFSSISEKLLIATIQNNNLRMSEIRTWEHVIKWGLAQNPELPPEYTSFSKDDINTLKNTLQQCIPHIRFQNLTSKEFLHNIFPHREILPKGLYIDLLKFFLNSDYRPSDKSSSKGVDSVIISNQHVELISKWVNKLEITDELTTSNKFKLLYRESRDGSGKQNNSFNKFREICKNRSHTIIVIKVKNSNGILGGIENYVLSRVKNEKKAIYNGTYYHFGPSFDADLYVYRDIFDELRIGCEKNSYEENIEKINYSYVEEFEVFQIDV